MSNFPQEYSHLITTAKALLPKMGMDNDKVIEMIKKDHNVIPEIVEAAVKLAAKELEKSKE